VDRWFEIAMSMISGLSLLVLTLVLFVLRDFRDRIMRLESNAMHGTGSAIAYRRVGAAGQG
jgi:hypothetical protein